MDTIAAIATALSESGIGIIRISGPEAVEIADRVIRNRHGEPFLKNVKSHTIHYGFSVSMQENREEIVDEVLVSVMLGPKSFTGEDTVEVNCHGGIYVLRKVLKEVCKAGARLAEPGEFSKRAFLNGRMDLAEAEAVMDLISSQNEISLHASVEQLSGRLSGEIRKMREEILYETARIESALDDPEHFSLDGYGEELDGKLIELCSRLEKMIHSYENGGRILKDGIRTAILGKPNSGKSSLLNLLVGSDRAIVTEVAGTTRDTLEEWVRFGPVTLHLIDTAGIHDTEDVVERIGVQRAKEAAASADLLLLVIDGSLELDEEEKALITEYSSSGRKCLVLLNKSDLVQRVEVSQITGLPVMIFSAKTGEGLEELKDWIRDRFLSGEVSSSGEVVITSERHEAALRQAFDSLGLVRKSIADGMEEDFFTVDLMNAYVSLGKILGEALEDDLVDQIFSKFCMGK